MASKPPKEKIDVIAKDPIKKEANYNTTNTTSLTNELKTPVLSKKKRDIPKGQRWFINKMKIAGYETTNEKNALEGHCFGIAQKAREAFLSGDIKTFENRLAFINDKGNDYFENLKEGHLGKTNTEDEFSPYDVKAFFDGVSLYQAPHKYPEIFTKGEKLSQSKRPAQNIVTPSMLDDDEELRPVLTSTNTGAYTKDELIIMFSQLKNNLSVDTSLILRSVDHAINLNYDKKNNTWILVDANELPAKKFTNNDIENLSEEVINAFYVNPPPPHTAIFSTEIYTNKKNTDILNENLDSLKSNKQWIDIHKQDEKKSQRIDTKGYDLLYLAIDREDVDQVKSLVESRATLDKIYPNKISAFEKARGIKNIDILYTLSNNNMSIFYENLLLLDIKYNRKESFKTLLEEHIEPDQINNIRYDEKTLLTHFTKEGDKDIIEKLILKGCEINLCDDRGVSPLYIASQNGNLEVVKTLIRKGANINLGFMELDEDSKKYHMNPPLRAAAWKGNIEVVEALLEHPEVDVNLQDINNQTPLHLAAEGGHNHVIKALLKNSNINVNLIDVNGDTPLMVAIDYGQVDVIETLLNYGANLNIKNNDGKTPLDIAIDSGNEELISIISNRLKTASDSINYREKSKTHSEVELLYSSEDEEDDDEILYSSDEEEYDDEILYSSDEEEVDDEILYSSDEEEYDDETLYSSDEEDYDNETLYSSEDKEVQPPVMNKKTNQNINLNTSIITQEIKTINNKTLKDFIQLCNTLPGDFKYKKKAITKVAQSTNKLSSVDFKNNPDIIEKAITLVLKILSKKNDVPDDFGETQAIKNFRTIYNDSNDKRIPPEVKRFISKILLINEEPLTKHHFKQNKDKLEAVDLNDIILQSEIEQILHTSPGQVR